MLAVANRITPLIDGGAIFPVADKLLSEAKESIQLEMFELGNQDVDGSKGPDVPGYAEQQKLIPDLVAAAQRGVKVQVLLDQSRVGKNSTNNDKTLDYLKAHGVEVLAYPSNVVHLDHVKSLVVDGTSALIGGMNWGSHSPANHDADVLIEGDAARLVQAEVFEKDWEFSGGKIAAPTQTPVSGGPIQVVTTRPKSELGGSHAIKDAVIDKIRTCTGHAYVEMFTLTATDVVKELVKAKKRGVDVRVILDPTEQAVNMKAFKTLHRAKVDVRWYATDTSVAQKLHAKWGEFDGHGLIVGSCNWSANGFGALGEDDDEKMAFTSWTHNHEADVVIQDDTVAQTFQNQFLQDWDKRTTTKLTEDFVESIQHSQDNFTMVEKGE